MFTVTNPFAFVVPRDPAHVNAVAVESTLPAITCTDWLLTGLPFASTTCADTYSVPPGATDNVDTETFTRAI